MSKMFKYSDDADVPALNIFDTPATNTSVRNVRPSTFQTSQPPNSESLQFTLTRAGLNYYDLRDIRLFVKAKIVDKDGNPPAEGDNVFPINHLLRTMWSKIEVKFGGKTVTEVTQHYPYKAMIQTLMYEVGCESDLNRLSTEMFYRDQHNHFDQIDGGLYTVGKYYRRHATEKR